MLCSLRDFYEIKRIYRLADRVHLIERQVRFLFRKRAPYSSFGLTLRGGFAPVLSFWWFHNNGLSLLLC